MLEVAPAADARGAHWSTHLFRAGRPYCALRLMKAQAPWLEIESAMRQHRAYHCFRRADQFFVRDVQHLAGQHGIPVVHHGEILPIVAAESREIVGKGLARREALLEAA